jgi:hypothetical protein
MHISLIREMQKIAVFTLHTSQWHDATYLNFVKEISSEFGTRIAPSCSKAQNGKMEYQLKAQFHGHRLSI